MIPDIGLMIAAYTITRLIGIMEADNRAKVSKVLAGVALVITAISLYDLLSHGVNIPGVQ